MIGTSFAALRSAFTSRLAIGLGGLLALGATTIQTVVEMPSQGLPALAAGQSLDAGRWRVAVLAATVSNGPRPNGQQVPRGTRLLSVDLDMLNRTSETTNTFARVLSVDPEIPGLQPNPSFYLLRDGSLLEALHPGLPERVRVVWTMPETVQLPRELRLTVTAESFKPRDNLLAAPGWFNPKRIAAVSLPIRPEGSAGAAP